MAAALSNQAAAAPSKSGMDSAAFVPFKLVKRVKLNHNTDTFTFALKDPSAALDLPVSSCIMTKFVGADGKDVVRPYTPVYQYDKGILTLVVKVYPVGGVMSKHIHTLNVGDSLEIKGPFPKLKYEANKWAQIGMVAGGTGLTPCLQVIDAIIANPQDKTQVHLVFANSTPEDILLKARLDEIASKHSNFKVTYVVDEAKAPNPWSGRVGHVNKKLLAETMPAVSDSNLVYVCGPPGFMVAVSGTKNLKDYSQGELTGALKEMGYSEKHVFKF